MESGMKKKKIEQRILSFILAVSVLFITSDIPVLAENTKIAKQQQSLEEDFGGVTGERSADSPANPVHHCTKGNDGTDYTDWSYINLVSYPQTEFTGGDFTSSIKGAS